MDIILRNRLFSYGLMKGYQIKLVKIASMGNPRIFSILGYDLVLRNEIADLILVKLLSY